MIIRSSDWQTEDLDSGPIQNVCSYLPVFLPSWSFRFMQFSWHPKTPRLLLFLNRVIVLCSSIDCLCSIDSIVVSIAICLFAVTRPTSHWPSASSFYLWQNLVMLTEELWQLKQLSLAKVLVLFPLEALLCLFLVLLSQMVFLSLLDSWLSRLWCWYWNLFCHCSGLSIYCWCFKTTDQFLLSLIIVTFDTTGAT